jgi:hypothetical protein
MRWINERFRLGFDAPLRLRLHFDTNVEPSTNRNTQGV